MSSTYFLIGLLVLILLFGIRILSPRKAGVVTFLGKISRVIREGFNIIIPFLESVHYQTLALTNLNVTVDGITRDNVTTAVNINVVYRVKEDDQSIIDSVFKNSNVVQTIKALVEEQLRAKVFEFEHEEIFGKRNEIGDEIREALEIKLAEFGMILDSVQVVDIVLDGNVLNAMNQVVSAQKFKTASITEAEGRKQSEILKAEGDKEVKRLMGEGMAEQRKAIAEGFQESIEKIRAVDKQLSGDKILQFLLDSSRIETLEKIGNDSAKVIYINENLEGKRASLIAEGGV
jgi:regulator of protease activity HflC (stomatin/prohibitin superfamily)